MKHNKLHIVFCAAATALFCSCSDWFDITPSTDIKAEVSRAHWPASTSA